MDKPLSPDRLRRMNASWRPANYLSVGQTYLYDDPLLKKPLKREYVKPRLLGHWGTKPGRQENERQSIETNGNPRLGQDVKEARWVLERLPELGISIDNVRRQLEGEGVEKFNKPFDKLMETLAQRSPRHLTRES